MNKIKLFIARHLFKGMVIKPITDAGSTGGNTGRELASTAVTGVVYKNGDSTDFEDPEYDLEDIQNGYATDSYIRQGVDKYVDQIFKEGYSFYGNDSNIVDYVKLRLSYIAEATQIPFNQFMIEIAEDLVKYGNAMIVKVRGNDPNALPQGSSVTGLYGKDPVIGYFCADPVTMKCSRDEYGKILSWQQESSSGDTKEFPPEDVIHFYYKKDRGYAYGTSFLVPVLDDVRALRQAEENVLKMMYRNIYPFHHVAVGTEEAPGGEGEVTALQSAIDNMDVEGGIVTTERVKITPIASDKVIDAEPYLRYLEERIFSGMGIPPILFGRGGTSNRSTGDNMTSEMADRIRALCKIIEMFFNEFIIKELLMEGGYDPVVNPDSNCSFRFNDNDVDVKIKKEVHAIYKYEHNAITETEMRAELGLDPIEEGSRAEMFVELITRENARQGAALTAGSTGTGETNNKESNSGGRPAASKSGTAEKKPAPKSKDYEENIRIGLIKDFFDQFEDNVTDSIISMKSRDNPLIYDDVRQKMVECSKSVLYTIDSQKTASRVQDYVASRSTALVNDICDSIAKAKEGKSSYSSAVDIAHVQVSIFKDCIIKMLAEQDAA